MGEKKLKRERAGGGTLAVVKLAGWVAPILLAGVLMGCHPSSVNTQADKNRSENVISSKATTNSVHNVIMQKQIQKAPKGSLIVSKPNNTGRMVRLGTLNFDESNQATLSAEGSGPEVDALKATWAEISKMKELTWKQSQPGEINGEKVMRIVGEKAKPGDDNYIYAVLNTLERKYGYVVDLAHQ
jgi:hypothetical protein